MQSIRLPFWDAFPVSQKSPAFSQDVMAALKQIPSTWTFKGNFFGGGSWLQPSGKASNKSSRSAKQEICSLFMFIHFLISYTFFLSFSHSTFHTQKLSTYNTRVNRFRSVGGIQNKTRPFQCLVFQYPLKNPQRLLPLCCPSTCTHHCTRSDMVRSNL